MIFNDGRWAGSRRLRRTVRAVVAMGMLVAPAAVLGSSGTAMAITVPYYCGTAGSGQTWGLSGGNQGGATVFTKSSTTPLCSDFNVVYTQTSTGQADSYLGLYLNGSTWVQGAAGYIPIPDNSGGDWVLLTQVLTGTKMKIWSKGDQELAYVNY